MGVEPTGAGVADARTVLKTFPPALWALWHLGGSPLDVSVAPIVGDTPWRKGLEALAIAGTAKSMGTHPRSSSVACRLATGRRQATTPG